MVGVMSQSADAATRSGGQPDSLRAIALGDYNGDWETTKAEIRTAISSAVSIFQNRGPPRARQSAPSPCETPNTNTELSSSATVNAAAAVDALPDTPTSPTITTTQVQADDPVPSSSTNDAPSSSSSPLIGPEAPTFTSNLTALADSTATGAGAGVEDLPSTPGGLVIPPFPPLDPERRKRAGSGSSEGSPSRPTHILISRPNGLGHPAHPIRLATGNGFGDDYDEDVVIGGKTLAGWMGDEEGRKEAERLSAALDDLDEPPFTIQRLAELLSNPTAGHSSLGKFLRAVEKTLLVQTPWQPQAYIAEPEIMITGSTSRTQYDPTLPPVMSTPKFSPIPWLQHTDEGAVNGVDQDGLETGHRRAESSISPMLLTRELEATEAIPDSRDEEQGIDMASASASARSPSPEPEETAGAEGQQGDAEMETTADIGPALTATAPEQATSIAQPQSHDPGHQPYLGRVDELDTGPIPTGPLPSNGEGTGDPREEERIMPGQGEGGAMTPHGMSEKPVPISSTTVIGEEERRIAGLRQSGARSSAAAATGEDVSGEAQSVAEANDAEAPSQA